MATAGETQSTTTPAERVLEPVGPREGRLPDLRALDPRVWIGSAAGRTYALAIALIVMWLGFDKATNGVYFGSQNVTNVLNETASVGIVAIGVVVVLLLGEIDLSLGSLAGLCGCAAVLIMVQWLPTAADGVQAVVGIVAAIAIGIICGAFQGMFVAWFKVPSFVVTLAGLLAFLGITLVITDAQTTTIPSQYFDAFGTSSISAFDGGYLTPALGLAVAILVGVGYTCTLLLRHRSRVRAGLPGQNSAGLLARGGGMTILGVVVILVVDRFRGLPLPAFVMLLLLVVFAYVLRRTRFGRHLYATGGSSEAARRAGINVTALRWSAFIISGMMAGIGGIVIMATGGAASAGAVGQDFLLNVIAAAVIGGTSLFGGRGTVWSALMGALVLSSVDNGMGLTLNGNTETEYYTFIVKGAILLLAVWLDTYVKRRSVEVAAG